MKRFPISSPSGHFSAVGRDGTIRRYIIRCETDRIEDEPMDNVPLTPSRKAQELFDATRRRIQGLAAAQRLWDRHLNDTEKQILGRPFRRAFEQYPKAEWMWAKVKNVNQSIAVIDVAETLNFITQADAEWLRREGGELPSDPAEAKNVAIERGDLVLSLKDKKLHWNFE